MSFFYPSTGGHNNIFYSFPWGLLGVAPSKSPLLDRSTIDIWCLVIYNTPLKLSAWRNTMRPPKYRLNPCVHKYSDMHVVSRTSGRLRLSWRCLLADSRFRSRGCWLSLLPEHHVRRKTPINVLQAFVEHGVTNVCKSWEGRNLFPLLPSKLCTM
jgi:hypothetical protein